MVTKRNNESISPVTNSHLQGKIPLRLVFIIPFLLQIFAAVGLTAWFSIRNGEQAVQSVAVQWQDEITDRIEQKLITYLDTPHLINQINADAIELGILNLASESEVKKLLLKQIHQFPTLNRITIATKTPAYFEIQRSDNDFQFSVFKSNQNNIETWKIDHQGNLIKPLPIQEAKYLNNQSFVIVRKPMWAKISTAPGTSELIISAQQSLLNPQSESIGLIQSQLSLSEISNFLQQLNLGQKGYTFIMERNGFLIAASDPQQSLEMSQKRLSVFASPNIMIQKTAEYLQSQLGDFRQIKQERKLELDINNQPQFLEIFPFTDPRGIEWLVVVSISKSDFGEHLDQNTQTTIFLCIIALGIATSISILTSRWIGNQIQKISAVSQAIAQDFLEPEIDIPPIYELAVLADSLQQMQNHLKQSFLELKQTNETLEMRVEERTQALRSSEEKFSTAFRCTPHPITLTRLKDGIHVEVNDQFLNTIGYTREEVLGRTALELNLWVNLEDRVRLFELLTEQGVIDNYEFEFQTRSGEIRTSLLSAEIITWNGEEYLLSVSNDITNRKRLEAELRNAKNIAEQATQEKSKFLAMMSHEIRTPIHGVLGMTDLLAKTHLTPEQQHYVNTIEISGDSLLTVINDILDFSKIESGRLELEKEPIHLTTLIENVLDMLAAKADEKDIDLVYWINPEVPTWVRGDMTHLTQILINLVNNGIKFTDHGEILIQVDRLHTPEFLTQISAEFQLRIGVRDTGIGLDPIQQEQLFQPFFQLDPSRTHQQGGTGLGLVICKRLVELMGGKIWVESSPGQGSTFFFTLQTEMATTPAPPPSLPILTHKRVLLVDDNAACRDIFSRYCQQFNMISTVASTGEMALTWIKEGAVFDLALVDLKMPKMDGLTLGEQIRHLRSHRELPLILLTTLHPLAGDQDIFHNVFNCQISKPIKQTELGQLMSDVLMNHQMKFLETPPPSPASDQGVTKHLNLKILLVEDNLINQEFILTVLDKLGYQVDVANNGREAIQACLQKPYDIVFMDIQMPEMDGLEASRQLRHQLGDNQPAIIAMTANAMPEDEAACREAGMDDYLSKPMPIEVIEEMLAKWGRRHPTTAPSPAVVLDQTAMIIGMKDHKPELVRKMVKLFLDQEGPRQLNEIKAAVGVRDQNALQYAAHTFKGGCSILGATRLVALCQQLEMKAKIDDWLGVQEVMIQLDQTYQQVEAELVKLL